MRPLRWLLYLLLLAVSVAVADAQTAQLEILNVDSSSFPDVAITLRALTASGAATQQFDNIELRENGVAVDQFEIVPTTPGVAVTFVIDANATISGIDLIGDVSRLEKVATTIDDFSRQVIGREGDSVTIIAPVDGQPQRLISESDDTQAIRAALDAYQPETLPRAAPVQEMLTLAFEQAADNPPNGPYQAVVLFSDAEQLNEQVDFFELRRLAGQSDVVFFGVILGKVASQSEVESMAELYIPTGGDWIHMPQPEAFEPIETIISSNRTRPQLRYRSTAARSGEQSVTVVLDGAEARTAYSVSIQPPQIDLLEPTEIVRSGERDEALTALQPTTVDVLAQLTWPDGHPRRLDEVRFFVDGLEQSLSRPAVLDRDGVLSVTWNLGAVDVGQHQLLFELRDELGLTVRSEPFVVVVERQQTGIQPLPTIAPTATAAAVATPTVPPPEWQSQITTENINRGLLILIGLLALILLIKAIRRRNRPPSAPTPTIVRPSQPRPANVYLELLDGGQLLPVLGDNVRIGSDPFRADIVIDHESVSRYHGRIAFEGEQFVLYDEGSANGTRVNFQRIGLVPRPLINGDEVHFGSVETRFRIFGEDVPEAENDEP